MSAGWKKNETDPAKRRATMRPAGVTDGSKAPRGTSFVGYLYIGKSSATAVAAIGTLTNVRRPLVVADDVVESVDTGANTLTLTAHGLETGDGPVQFTNSGGALPTGLAVLTNYWIIRDSANAIRAATSLANAYGGTPVDITGAGTGTHTLVDTASTERGIDGEFVYEADPTELTGDGSEIGLYIAPESGYDAFTSVLYGAAESARDVLLAYSHDTGVTVKGLFRRLEALVSGKATGLLGATARFFMRDETTPAVEAPQDTAAGTRSEAIVTGSEA